MTVVKELDFEETQTYFVNIQASDKAAPPERRRTALTVLTVHVTDSDDQVMTADVKRHYICDDNVGLVTVGLHESRSMIGSGIFGRHC